MKTIKGKRQLVTNGIASAGLLRKEQKRKREREMFMCEMHGMTCSYWICDECPITNSEYERGR